MAHNFGSTSGSGPLVTAPSEAVPLLDLRAQYDAIRKDLDAAVATVFSSQQFVLGKTVAECEAAIAEFCGVRHAIGVSSGTDALLAALMAEKLGPGDEVITTPYTFFATAGSIARVGARPVFVDIDPSSFNIDVRQIDDAVTSQTRVILPVHLFGQMAEMEEIEKIASRRGLILIEDAAQAIGATRQRRRAGSIGAYGCFSFFPSKNLGCAGDGGMVVTQDAARAETITMLRNHGSKVRYSHALVGGNFRLDALQAAIVHRKLQYLPRWTARRQANAQRYRALFRAAGLDDGRIILPEEAPGHEGTGHVYNQFVIRAPGYRDALKAHLQARNVGCEVYYPIPLHLQECFRSLGYREGSFPESERAARETLALPIYPELSDAQAQYVVESILGYFQSGLRSSQASAAA